MPITDYITWDWKRAHTYTQSDFALIRDYFSPIDPSTGALYDADTMADIIAEFSQFIFGDETLGPHYHIKTAVPPFHRNIYRDLSVNYQFYYITAPSHFGKTTVATVVYPIYRALYRLDAYITVGGSTQKLSVTEHFRNIQAEFEDNEKLILVYGEQRPKTLSRLTRGRLWNTEEMLLTNDVYITPLGCEGKIRGRKRGSIRPTLVIVDDPEEVADIRSATKLKAHYDWLFRDVMYRIDNDSGKIRIIGNMLSDTCLLAQLKRDKQWRGVDYSALDANNRSIWEDKWPTQFLLNERQAHIESGRYAEWMYERMNRPVVLENRRIRYITADLRLERKLDQNLLYVNDFDPVVCTTWLGIDPEVAADDIGPRAMVTLARAFFPSRDNKDIMLPCTFAIEYVNRALGMGDIIDVVADNHEKFYYSGVAIESNTWQKIFQEYFSAYMATSEFYNKHPFRFIPILAQRQSKVTRILKFQIPGSAGMLYINKDMPALKEDFDFVSLGAESGLHIADAFEMGWRHSSPPAQSVRSYPNEDAHVNYRYHTPWKDVIKQNPMRDAERHDAWKHIRIAKV